MILLKQILVATDFSDTSAAAMDYGRALARTFGASLHLLHVMENPFLRPTRGGSARDPERDVAAGRRPAHRRRSLCIARDRRPRDIGQSR